jgi:N-acyl-L-homoserine lactone synthetase
MSYQFIEVTSEKELEKVYAFRYQIVCEKLGVDELDNCEFGRETDEYDAYSEHFAAFDENDEVVACTRLIHHSPLGYPTDNNMKTDIDKKQFEVDKFAELSRIFIASHLRNLKDTRSLIEGLKVIGYNKMAALGIEYTYGALEKPFLRLLNMYKLPYKAIGEEQHYITPRYPCLLYTHELEAVNPKLLVLMGTA